MKFSLIAFAACYAVTNSAFALPTMGGLADRQPTQADLPGTNPPRLALTDLPGTNPPRLTLTDLPGTNPPRFALTDLPGTNPPRLG